MMLKSHGKERLKRKAFGSPLKTDIESADMTVLGQIVPTTKTGKAHSQMVDSLELSRCHSDERMSLTPVCPVHCNREI